MKEFRIELVSPPQGVYFPGMMVTGSVICVTDAPQDYTQVKITLYGGAFVHWSESGLGENQSTRYFSAKEHYINLQAVLWDSASLGGGKFPAGSFRFNFTFQLAQAIPPSYTGSVGSITYTLEARAVRTGIDAQTVATLNVSNSVQSITPQSMEPLSMETSKTVGCLCCESGPIVLRARIPRTGFCVGYDTIPVEVTVENGSNNQINNIRVTLQKRVLYTAQGHYNHDTVNCGTVNTRTVAPRETTSLQLEPIPIPADLVPTLDNCGVVKVGYFVVVQGSVSYAFNPVLKLPILIGNVPLNEGNPPPTQYMTGGGFPGSAAAPPPSSGTTWQPAPSYPSDPVPLGFVDPIKKI